MKIAVVAVLAGLMLTVAIIAAVSPRAAHQVQSMAAGPTPGSGKADLERCRAATAPDEACERVWAARQRRFFSTEDHKR